LTGVCRPSFFLLCTWATCESCLWSFRADHSKASVTEPSSLRVPGVTPPTLISSELWASPTSSRWESPSQPATCPHGIIMSGGQNGLGDHRFRDRMIESKCKSGQNQPDKFETMSRFC
jgi:hypothetical protein